TADPVRVAMILPPLCVVDYESRQTPVGAIDFRLIKPLWRRSPRRAPNQNETAADTATAAIMQLPVRRCRGSHWIARPALRLKRVVCARARCLGHTRLHQAELPP